MSGQIWMNGELVAYEDAKVHVLTHALHYGTSVFEGVRAYEMPDGGSAVFRHQDHIDRLFRSAGLYHMELGYTKEQIRQATFDVITASGLKSCYIRPLVFRGAGPMGLYPLDCPVDVMIAVWEWGAYLGDEGKRQRRARRGVLVAADLLGRADPDGEGRRPVPELDPGQDRGRQGRLRGGDPAGLARLRVRGDGREPVPGQGRAGVHAGLRQRHPRGHQPPGGRSRSCATRATRSSSATSPAASSTAPTRSS